VARQASTKSTANIGTPQGDALSPILFIIYLDAALKEYWEEYGKPDTPQYQYCMYADDTSDHFFTKLYLPDVLKKWNLQMNLRKKEHTTLAKEKVHTNDTKKLGTKMSDQQDVAYRRGGDKRHKHMV
jgi:retron-type reverse transcriptase